MRKVGFNKFQTAAERDAGINALIYKTGDLVRWRLDGNLEYIGRNDSQITPVRSFNFDKQSPVVVSRAI